MVQVAMNGLNTFSGGQMRKRIIESDNEKVSVSEYD